MARRAAPLLTALAILGACQGAADPPMPLPRSPPETPSQSSALPLAPPPANEIEEPEADAPLEVEASPSLDGAASGLSARRTRDASPGSQSPEGLSSTLEPLGPEELVSIATETSIFAAPRWDSRRLGYLRAGAAVKRSRAPVGFGPKCADGWYRVEPRGFVCVGSLATLDRDHPVALASARRPRPGDDLPYLYALSRSPPPMLYARIPSLEKQIRFEQDLDKHLTKVPAPPPASDGSGSATAAGEGGGIPEWLLPGKPSLSLGNLWHAPDRVALGLARPRSGFALLTTFESAGRRFGVTTGLEILPLDRVRLVKPSSFAGIALGGDVTLPVAFAKRRGALLRVPRPSGVLENVPLGFREAVPITEEIRTFSGTKYLVARDGSLLLASQFIVAKALRRSPSWALDGAKWIEISIPRQTLVAYEGQKPVYATLVSTGVGGTGDPKETHATIQGAFRIYEKHISVTMDGTEQSDADLRDVPFVQYFNEGFALHGVYWHDDFGRMHSHGCVNLSPRDAAWLFSFTDPRVPPSWHGVTSKKSGTIVYVHD